MAIKIDIPIQCAIKEIETAHEAFIRGMRSRDSIANRQMAYDLATVANSLGLKVQCVCYDPMCEYWQEDSCRCGGDERCLNLGYLIRAPSPLDRSAEPTNPEIELAKTLVPETEKVRQPNELFIVWKVRVANRVYKLACDIHFQPTAGMTDWQYMARSSMSEEETHQDFMNFIKRIRTMSDYERPSDLDVTKVVGCSTCCRVFKDEESLNAHVDRERFNGDSICALASGVSDSTYYKIRPTPLDFRPPLPSLEPESESEVQEENDPEIMNGAINRIRIDYAVHESTLAFRSRIRALVTTHRRLGHPNAVGCTCGRIYKDIFRYTVHGSDYHGWTTPQIDANLIKP